MTAGANKPRRLDRRGRDGAGPACRPRAWRRCAASGFRARCTARPCWMRRDEVLRPCILWNDTRSHDEAAELDARSDVPPPDGQHRLSRLYRAKTDVGQRSTNPQIWDRVAKVLLPKDYLRLWLTGEHVGRDVGCRRNQLAGYRRARLVRRSAGGDRTDARPHAAPGRRVRRSPAPCAQPWPRAGACPRASSSRAAAATTRPRASASAWCARARPLSRLAPRACSLPPMTAISPTRQRPCTPFATPCRAPGTRWA